MTDFPFQRLTHFHLDASEKIKRFPSLNRLNGKWNWKTLAMSAMHKLSHNRNGARRLHNQNRAFGRELWDVWPKSLIDFRASSMMRSMASLLVRPLFAARDNFNWIQVKCGRKWICWRESLCRCCHRVSNSPDGSVDSFAHVDDASAVVKFGIQVHFARQTFEFYEFLLLIDVIDVNAWKSRKSIRIFRFSL